MPAATLDRLRPVTKGATRRLLVTRKVDGDYRAIGILTESTNGYRFAYLESAVDQPWFHPLPGLRLERAHQSPTLFPLFASRVIEDGRPDRAASIARLGLPQDSTPFEILERSGGRRIGDAIEVLPLPEPSPDGALDFSFFVHGIRHLDLAAQEMIANLSEGALLRMAPEPENEADASAICVVGTSNQRLGYVPRPLTQLVGQVLEHQGTLRVQKAHGADVSFHLRLLVQLSGSLPQGHLAFDGPGWRTVDL